MSDDGERPDTRDRLDPRGAGSEGLYNSLSDHQRSAAKRIVGWYADSPSREFYLAGEAGTGKTTIASWVIRHLDEAGLRVLVGAYTGKAAAVLRKKGVSQAQTLHSMIYHPVEGSNPVRFEAAYDSPLGDADLLIVDEVSMVSHSLAADVRSYRRKVFVLGDPGQLPPISGAGAFTDRDPDFTLTEIHRQAASSPIIKLAYRARRGLEIDTSDDPRATVAPLSFKALLGAEGQILCGTHRARWAITRKVREKLGFSGLLPNPGERVICRKNDHAIGLYNGMLGTIIELLDDGTNDFENRPYLRVKMDDLSTPVETLVAREPWMEHEAGKRLNPPLHQRGVQLFDFGHVLTVHSAQGSEWESVVVVDDSSAFGDDRHRWLYTAITRASERVTLLRRDVAKARVMAAT